MSDPHPHIVQKDGHDGGIHIEIAEGVAKWLSIVLALMFLGAIFVAGEALSQAADARADASAARERTQVAIDAAQAAQRQADRVDAKSVYFIQRAEGFLEQLSAEGYKVPPDLLHYGAKK